MLPPPPPFCQNGPDHYTTLVPFTVPFKIFCTNIHLALKLAPFYTRLSPFTPPTLVLRFFPPGRLPCFFQLFSLLLTAFQDVHVDAPDAPLWLISSV